MFIFKKEKVLNEDKCRRAIRWYDNTYTDPMVAQPGTAGEKKLENIEIGLPIDSDTDKEVENHYWGIGKKVKNAMVEYIKKHPEINGLAQWKLTPTAQFAMWEPGKYYHYLHCENEGKYHNRFLSWMIFLNDIKEGGRTYFPQYNTYLEPKAGDFYIWPAGWTHLHRGEQAPSERKYTVTGWYEYV